MTIVMVNVDPPGPKRIVKIEPARDPAVAPDQTPASLRFLRWASATRLVYAPVERIVPLPPLTDPSGRATPNPDGPTIVSPIFVADADGKERGTLIDARNFQETPADARRTLADLLRTTKELVTTSNEPVRWRMPHLDILGFSPQDRNQLILQTRGAYSPTTQHAVDTTSGNVTVFDGKWPSPPGEPQVFDWFRLKVVGARQIAARPTTAWRDEELARVQQELEVKFPRRTVEILDWSETRARVLFRVGGGSDPGRVFVFQRTEDLVLEIFPRAPWLGVATLHETRYFEFPAPDGAPLSGYLTWPKKPRVDPLPLLVVFPVGFPGRAQPAFDPEAQVFADLGFAVLRLNHRGVAGVRPQDLTALRAAVDRVSVDDARAAIAWIATRRPDRPIDRKRVAVLGQGFGGYLAVRALQLYPAEFRCGIAVDAPLDLHAWLRATAPGAATATRGGDVPVALLDHAAADWKNLSAVEQAAALTNPVLLLVEPARFPAIDRAAGELREKLLGLGRTCDYVELDAGYAAALPAARASVYRKMEEFLAAQLSGFSVKIGPTKEVE